MMHSTTFRTSKQNFCRKMFVMGGSLYAVYGYYTARTQAVKVLLMSPASQITFSVGVRATHPVSTVSDCVYT
jgi:hypothetical protein